MHLRRSPSVGHAAFLAGSLLLAALPAAAQDGEVSLAPRQPAPVNASTDPFLRVFRWRSIGPSDMGGRVDDIAASERDPRTYYVGYATGGVWKTSNGGTTFEPVFDAYRTSHVGAVAVAASNPDVVWVGTGEGNNRNSSSYGEGVFKSTDGGKTFQDMGLHATQSIHRIVIDPTNPDVVFVAAVGALYGPSPDRGLYRTTDGGRTWSKVLYVDENTGANSVVMVPGNPRVLFASTYERRRTAWGFNGGGPGSGIWKSVDGGTTWTRLKGNGLPGAQQGRIALDVSRSNPNIVYAQIEVLRDEDRVAGQQSKAGQRAAVVGDNVGGIWRSNDQGATWEFRSNHNVRPGYFSIIRIDPKNPEVVYTAGRRFYRSEDGAKTFRVVNGPGHGDYHAIWVNPNDSNHLMVGNDGGFDASYDRGRTFEAMRPGAVAQVYAVSVDMRRPYFVCGGLQDNSSWCGPSAVGWRFISAYDWYNVGAGDGGYTAQDPRDPNIVYAEGQRGSIRRLNLAKGEAISIQPRNASRQGASNIVPAPPASERFRWNWLTPYILSPHDPSTIYIGANRLFRSENRGDTWTMSPDLTRNINRDTMKILGVPGAMPDCFGDGALPPGQACIHSKNDGTWFYSTITTVSESPLTKGVLWVGTDDGNVQVSRGDLSKWTNVTANLRGAPKDCWISRVEASHVDAATAYVAVDCHRNNDMRPYVYVTRDNGATFTSITSNLPAFGCVNVIKQDPKNPSVLYVGTENGFYASLDEGKSWQPLMTGLPKLRVDDVVIHPRDGDLVLATHGRGFLIVDDVTPLQQLTDAVRTSDVHFFQPRTAVLPKVEQRLNRVLPGSKQFRGENPEPGVALHYYLKQASSQPVKLSVADASGKVIRTLSGTGGAGINRVQWDLLPTPVRLASAADMEDDDGPRVAPRPIAGKYRVTLTVNGQDYTRDVSVEDVATQP